MASGRIIEYDGSSKTYLLPREHAGFLTRAAGPDNLAAQTQYLALMGNVEQQIVESFRNGGGVPYSAYPRFQQLMAEESSAIFDATLIDITLPHVPGLMPRLEAGIDVLDIGCGSGHAINLMAKAFPNSRFTGHDFSEEGVATGRAEANSWGLTNALFHARDVAALDDTGRYDFITAFDAIHDQAQPTKVLRAIAEALRPDGVFLMVDISASSDLAENLDHMLGPLLYTVSTMHCMTVSLALNGEGLGTMWGEQLARQKLAEAGFASVDVKKVPGDIFNRYYIATTG
jgi:2-polyprenyl-3-methyl-5-hydroxy-6-metoxy-1,4-benzoquinol methylase